MSSSRQPVLRRIFAANRAAPCLVLLIAGCASVPPPGPTVLVLPGHDKDLVAFQQDDTICRQHAAARTGFDAGPATPAPAGRAANDTATGQPAAGEAGEDTAADTEPADKTAYAQCMASRGDVVQVQPGSYPAINAYGYPDLDPYANWYGAPYAFGFPFYVYGGRIHRGFGWSRDGFYHGIWHGRGFAAHGFARSGFGRGGYARGGGGGRH